MKKLLSLILALTMIICVALTSCTQEKTNVDDNTENDAFQIETTPLYQYNAELEAKLAEIEPKDVLDEEILASVNGLPVSAANVRYLTTALKAPADSNFTEEELVAEFENFYKENAALVEFAFESDLKLTDEDMTTIKANIAGIQLQLGNEYEAFFTDNYFTKHFYSTQTSLYQTIYSKLYDMYYNDAESDIVKKALADTIKYCAENDYIRAKHILVMFPSGEGENGAVTDAQKEATLAKANSILAEVNAMSDVSEFDALIEKYNEDPGMQSYPEGYYFGKGEMVAPFEEAAYALEENTTSGVVETNYGYHIIQRLPVTEDVIANSSAYNSFYADALYSVISEKADSYEVVYADNYDERVEDFMAEYKESKAEETAE